MKIIFNSLKVEFKIMIKSKLNIILLILAMSYNLYLYANYLFTVYEPGQVFVKSSYSVQGGILAFIMLGIHLERAEKICNIKEVIETIHNGMIKKIIAKFLFVLMITTMYVLINIVSIYFLFSINKIPFSSFYTDGIKYMLLYWEISFIISAMIGFFIAHCFKGKIVYIIALVIWLLISPMNYPFFIQLGILFKLDNTFELLDFFNLGQNNIYYPYNSFYGFSLENFQWIKKLLFFSILFGLNLIVIFRKGIQKSKTIILLIIVCGFISIFSVKELKGEQQILRFDREKDAIAKKDSEYYQNTELKSEYIVNFKINSYNIDLNVNKNLSAEVEVELENISKNYEKEIHLLLYNGFSIKELKTSDGDKVSFQQNKDNVIVNLNNEIKPNEKVKLKFKYEGVSSPFFVANNRAIYLPNYYAWIPMVSEFNTIMINEGFNAVRLPIVPKNKINYFLKINENLNIYTNLEKEYHNTWKGTSNDGIYIVKGSVDEEIIDQTSVIYPLTWERTLSSFNSFKENVDKRIDKIINDLNLNNTVNIDRVMFLETTITSDKYYQQISFNSKALTINPNLYFINGYDSFNSFDKGITSGLIASLTWKKDSIVTDKLEELSLFDNSYAYFLNNFFDDTSAGINLLEGYIYDLEYNFEVSQIPESGIKFNKEKNLEVALKLKEYIDNTAITDNEKSNFFKSWYEKINVGNIPSIEEILKNLKERGQLVK